MSNLSINESNDNSNVSILLNKSGAQSSTNSSHNLIVFKQPEDLSIQLQQQQQKEGPLEDNKPDTQEEEMEQITQQEVQQENQPDTLSSSPFISRPHSPLDDVIRPQGTSSPSLTIRDSYSSQVDINISNLHKSLNEMRLSTDSVGNNNDNNNNNNNKNNSDISNDDIITIDNLTPSRIKPKNISPWRQFRPALRGSPETTPRLLFQNKPNLKFNNNNSPTNGSRDMITNNTNNIATTTKSREEELNKRIVNYKIQLKLMKNFLQELIDRNNLDPHEFHTLLNRNNNNNSNNNNNNNNENNPLSTSLSQTSTLEIQHQNLQIELDEAVELNKQLYNNIEIANKEINDKDLQISNYESRINLINYSVDELIYILINEYDKNTFSGNGNTTSPGKETLQQSISAPLEVKLNVLKLELMTRLDQLRQYNKQPELFTPPYTSSEYGGINSNNNAATNKNDLEGYIHIIEDLIKTVDELELTCESYKANKNELQNQLVEQINESVRIKNNFQIMSNKFNQLRQSLNEKENDKNQDEFNKTNQQLEQKLIEYEKCIAILQDELDQYKQPSDITTTTTTTNNNNNNNRSSYSSYNNHRNSSLNELNLVNDYLQLQTSYSRINDELNQVNNDYKLLNSSTLEKINNLTTKLQEKSIELRNQMGLNNKLQTELNLSLDKQRKYNTERIQMSYTVDSLKKDNEALQLKVNKLTDLMTIDRTRTENNVQSSPIPPITQQQTVPPLASAPTHARVSSISSSSATTTTVNTNTNTNTNTTNDNNSSNNIELGVKKISILEYQYKDLLLYDTNQFKRLIESYNKIADDKSLYDPKMKYEKLLNHINDINNNNGNINGKSIDILENITYIRDKHKSIFEYFIRATDILINDHIKLLLKENDDSIKVKYNKLNDKLNKLIKENESLKSELEQQQQQQQHQQNTSVNTNDGDEYGNINNNDPLSKLRMNDLRNKWKAERERRILEDQEAKKRFKELELEIQRLNEVIGNNNNNNKNKQTTNDNN